MPKWTKEQLDAIEKTNTNIIVSAGAGSGKTAVLSERVVYKLKQGIKINELLILTFTNAAAEEMKNRIRKKISEEESIKDNLDYLESSYITTFDSFTLSLVKKYNYLLNVSPNLSIIDEGIIENLKNSIIEEVFMELYEEKDSNFLKLISDFAIKNDNLIKKAILKIINSISLKSNSEVFLNNYISNYLSDEKINEYIKEYYNLLKEEINNIESQLIILSSESYIDYSVSMNQAFEKLLNAKNYDEILKSINISLPRRPRNSEDIKFIKDNIDNSLKNLKSFLRFNSEEEIKESFLISKKYIITIIEIIKRFNKKLNNYKSNTDLYEFTDIAIMAINLLKEHSYIREELKNTYKEICIDEYQDTSDLQEEFINLIENNNVYMVGDIKQSIYGFRNANPEIFKEKYNKYNNFDGGIKIDLLKNFRSRKEVLDGINKIFSLIMNEEIGGADYTVSHQMLFGNMLYEEEKENQNYDLEILNYDVDTLEYTQDETEIFIIANDIKNKIKNNYKVIDKHTNKLRNVQYDDFCIIMDRGKTFPLFKKIFEYLNIPLTINEVQKLSNETEILLLNNLLGLIINISNHEFKDDFKYNFVSVSRSFLFEYSDSLIFEIIKNNSFKETTVFQKCEKISSKINELNNYDLLKMILKEFNFYEKIIKIGNVEEIMIRIDNLLTISKNLELMGYTPQMFKEYLNNMKENKSEITYKIFNNNTNSVNIMNIHKSKGLEFPICYYCGLQKPFNTRDIKERFTFDNKYGIITPFFKEGIGSTILKDLLKNKYNINNISERIRLFYVALTRAKEKIIIVSPLNKERDYIKNIVDDSIRQKYNSFLSILNSISANLEKYIKNIDLSNIGITKNYLYDIEKERVLNNTTKDIINEHEININNTLIKENHASKTVKDLISLEEYNMLKKGTLMHKYFEQTDFLNIDINNPYYNVINNFVKLLNINKNTKIYKEHEFIYEYNNNLYHGIIDLILVEDDVKIIDYKLKNIDDHKYIEQLKIYYNYIKDKFNKEIKVYLYSILNAELKEIKM